LSPSVGDNVSTKGDKDRMSLKDLPLLKIEDKDEKIPPFLDRTGDVLGPYEGGISQVSFYLSIKNIVCN